MTIRESGEDSLIVCFGHSLLGVLWIELQIARLGPGNSLICVDFHKKDRIRSAVGNLCKGKRLVATEDRFRTFDTQIAHKAAFQVRLRTLKERDLDVGKLLVVLAVPRFIEPQLLAYYRQSKRRTAEFLESLLGQPCNSGLTVKHENIATAAVRPAYDEVNGY